MQFSGYCLVYIFPFYLYISTDEEFKILQTRARKYRLKIESGDLVALSSTPHQYFLKCSDHESTKKWTSESENCSNCIRFKLAVLPNGRLPTLKSVIEYFCHLPSVDTYSVEYNVTLDLMNHWVKYNIYTLTIKTVPSRLTTHLEKLKYLINYPKGKTKDTYSKQYYEFVSASKQLFDIIASDNSIKAQEKI